MVTYDATKHQANLRKHGIDLAECEAVFDSVLVTREDTRYPYGEQRLISLGQIHGLVVSLCWTERNRGPHLISIRKATKHEQKHYLDAIGH